MRLEFGQDKESGCGKAAWLMISGCGSMINCDIDWESKSHGRKVHAPGNSSSKDLMKTCLKLHRIS